MEKKKLFQETQRFNQWWIWLIQILNIGMTIFFALSAYVQIVKGKPVGTKPAPDSILIIATIGTVLLCLLFFSMKLKTTVTKDRINFRFYPFHLKEQEYSLSDIEKMEVVKYNHMAAGEFEASVATERLTSKEIKVSEYISKTETRDLSELKNLKNSKK